LHFGAVDFQTEVFIVVQSVGIHWGGISSFDFDIKPYASAGKPHNLVVYVLDDVRSGIQPAGKQSSGYYSEDCNYTRLTGIWHTKRDWKQRRHKENRQGMGTYRTAKIKILLCPPIQPDNSSGQRKGHCHQPCFRKEGGNKPR
jgi:hypothetical protein